MRRIVALCLLLLTLLIGMSALAEAPAAPAAPVARNERFELFITEDLAGMEVLDTHTGRRWSSSMNDELFSWERVNAMWQKKMNSLLAINYTNMTQGLGSINSMSLLADKQYAAEMEAIPNGAKLHYTLGSCGISLTVEITLEEDSVLIRIPYDSIREEGIYSIVSIDLMPFFCSASDKAEGYFLYPDGCGALMVFQDDAHMNEKTQVYNVYGSLEQHPTLKGFFDPASPTVMLPVFGMSRGGQAVMAVIENGDETSRISVNCSNNIVKVNNMFANLQYRRGFDDLRVTDRSFKIYDRQAIETDYALRLLFLDDGACDYSAMARRYRDYLMELGTLSAAKPAGGLALDIFLTTNEDGLLIDVPRTVTTLAQAQSMLDDLHAAGAEGLHVALKGWSRNGYGRTPDRLPLSKSIGSDKAFQALMQTARDHGYDLSLTANFFEAVEAEGGYSKRNDVIYTGNFAILTNKGEDIYLLSPDVTLERYQAFAQRAKALAPDGVRFEWMGRLLSYNYFSRRTITASQTLEMYRQMMRGAREDFGTVSVQGGACYALPLADLLTEIPMKDYGYQMTTCHVPFYQMVVHGLRPYTGTPGNLCSDLQRELLRWVEMGYMPYFELTYSGTEDLMYTGYQSLFSARCEDWLDEVAEVAKAFNSGDLQALQGALMMQHDRLDSNVTRVRYDNGMTVYVNYGEQEAQVDGLTLPARDYLIRKEVTP